MAITYLDKDTVTVKMSQNTKKIQAFLIIFLIYTAAIYFIFTVWDVPF